MSKTKHKIANIAFALLLINTVIIGSVGMMSGSAYAQEEVSPSCSELDEFIWVLTIGILNSEMCDSSKLSQELADMENNYNDVVAADMYDKSNDAVQSNNEVGTLVDNSLNDARTVVWHKAEAAAISEMSNGGTEAEVLQAANQSIEDYYAHKQIQLSLRWTYFSREVGQLNRIDNQNSALDQEHLNAWGSIATRTEVNDDYYLAGNSSDTVTLVNGTTYNIECVRVGSGGDDSSWNSEQANVCVDTHNNADSLSVDDRSFSGLYLPPPESGMSGIDVMSREHEYLTIWTDIENQNTQMKDNAAPYIRELYGKYQNDTVSFDTYINPTTLAQEYATEYQGSGYYAYSVAASGAAGFSIPDLEGTGTMNMSYKGETYTGLLFSQKAPSNGKWEVGKTYNPEFIGGEQYFTTTDGETLTLTDTFTLEEMTNNEGEQITNTTTQDYDYDTIKNESYEERQEKIGDLKLAIDARTTTGSGGTTTDDGGFTLPAWLTQMLFGLPVYIWLIAVALVAALLFRSN